MGELQRPDRQRPGLHRDARLLQAQPGRPERDRADRLLDLAGGGPPGLPGAARRRVRHGARRRRLGARAAGAATGYREGDIDSPDGRVRAFDAGAQGTIFGSGLGVGGAEAAGGRARRRRPDLGRDPRHGGDQRRLGRRSASPPPAPTARSGWSAPRRSPPGVEPDTISYVEAHGTGTPVGDPIEVTALTRAFRERTDRAGFCAIGSVKTNIGHLASAAGVAGLIKTVLALEHRADPAEPHCSSGRTREIDFASSPFFVNTELREWQADAGPRRAGVSRLRHRRHQRPRHRRGGARARAGPSGPRGPGSCCCSRPAPRPPSTPPPANLAAHLEERAADERVPADLADVAYTRQIGRRQLRPAAARWSAGRSRGQRRRCLGGLATPAAARRHAVPPPRQPAASALPVLRPGGAVCRHGGRRLRGRAGLPRGGRPLCRASRAPLSASTCASCSSRPRSATRRPGSSSARHRFTQPALFVVEMALARLWMPVGSRAAGDGRPLDRRVRRGLPRRCLQPSGRARPGGGARPADAAACRPAPCSRCRCPRPRSLPHLLGAREAARPRRGQRPGRGGGRRAGRTRWRRSRPARGPRRGLPAPAHLARVPLADDGADPARLPRARWRGSTCGRRSCRTSPT